MKVFKFDPSYPGRGRSRTAPVQQNKCKIKKKSDSRIKSLDNTREASPIMFHHVKVEEMNINRRQDQLSQVPEQYENDGRDRQEPLVIKTDPRYNNSQLEISVSNKKLHNNSGKKGKKLTFLPSISNRSATTSSTATIGQSAEPDRFSNLSVVDYEGLNRTRNPKDEFFEVPSASSLGRPYSHERSHSGSDMRVSNESEKCGRLLDSPVLGRKFSSDVKLKLNKNNSQLQTIEGYSTCTFRVKMNDRNKIEDKSCE